MISQSSYSVVNYLAVVEVGKNGFAMELALTFTRADGGQPEIGAAK